MMDTSELQVEEQETRAAHWFYSSAGRDPWVPFSLSDNAKLEKAFNSGNKFADVFGGRFQADILALTMQPVYWESEVTTAIRRSWWYFAPSSIVQEWTPLGQPECEILETAYSNALSLNAWPVSVSFPGVGRVFMKNPDLMKIYPVDESGQPRENSVQNDVIKAEYLMLGDAPAGTTLKREFGAEFYAALPPNEPDTFDHLVLVVHGIGGVCDLRFRLLPECVNDLRQLTGRFLQQDHNIVTAAFLPNSSPETRTVVASDSITENNNRGAIEFLPIQWHSALHKGPEGLNEKLNRISLESCGKIRSFVNDTLLDVLLFTSPVYHQAIVENVVSEINRVYSLFRTKQPKFDGRVSLIGHSLGSVILFDILANQSTSVNSTPLTLGPCHSHAEAKLLFEPFVFFAMGSPLAMFLTVGGVNSIPSEFSLPSCKQLYNIFHPFDPVAYRIEPLIQQQIATELSLSLPPAPPPPVIIPHHRGRKRLHLEMKDVVTKIGENWRKVVGSLQSMAVFFKRTRTSSTPTQIAAGTVVTTDQDAEEVASTSALALQMMTEESTVLSPSNNNAATTQSPTPSPSTSSIIYNYGALNGFKRIDYVLQEGPIEVLNEYLFSIASHLCYWQSEDTCLFIARALYDSSPSTQS